MHIALNATPLLSPLTGIGQYTYQLIKQMQAMPEHSLDLFYANGWSTELRKEPIKNIVRFKSIFKRLIPNSYATSRLIQQLAFNQKGKSQSITLYHEPNFLPFKFKGPTVLTVHDLSWIRHPETHPGNRVKMMNRYFESGLRRADAIITDAEFIKQEIMDEFNIKPDLIHAIPLGVEQPLFQPQAPENTQLILKKHDLIHGQYFLSVGTLEPRKNLQATLRAFMQLPKAIRRRTPLILIGMKGWHTSALEQQIAPLVAAGEIRQLGYLPREELALIIAGALTLIFPSIYEGFGLPPLEAMTCGVPVIASNASTLPEVVGNTGYLVEPHDVDALSNAMEELVMAPDIHHALSQKALDRSQLFSWQKCAEQTLGVYQKVLNT